MPLQDGVKPLPLNKEAESAEPKQERMEMEEKKPEVKVEEDSEETNTTSSANQTRKKSENILLFRSVHRIKLSFLSLLSCVYSGR